MQIEKTKLMNSELSKLGGDLELFETSYWRGKCQDKELQLQIESDERVAVKKCFIDYFDNYSPEEWNVLFETHFEREAHDNHKLYWNSFLNVLANLLKREYIISKESNIQLMLIGHYKDFNSNDLEMFFEKYFVDLTPDEIDLIKQNLIFLVSKIREYGDLYTSIKTELQELQRQWKKVIIFFTGASFFEMWKNRYFLGEWYKLYFRPQTVFDILNYWFETMDVLCWDTCSFFVNINNSRNLGSYTSLFDIENWGKWKKYDIPIDFFKKYFNHFNYLVYGWENDDARFSFNYKVLKLSKEKIRE